MLTTGELYNDLGADYFQRRDPERLARRLVAQLESLGHKVTLEHLPQAA
jgi:transposase